MLEGLDYLRELNTVSVLFRLALAMLAGGLIGLERGRKRRAAGFRTYMLVSMGAALTMLLGQYHAVMLDTRWAAVAAELGVRTDVSRMGAQVINGIGFLGAGTILVTRRQEVKGLTTAAGLWASACMGLAAGAGFFECVLPAFALMVLAIRLLPYVENFVIDHARNLSIYVELSSVDHIGAVIACIKEQDVHIYDVDIDRGRDEGAGRPSAVFALRTNQKTPHEQILTAVSGLEGVFSVEVI